VVVGEIIPAAVALYAAYWAFSVRGALAGRIYRRHAFLLGVVCVLVAATGFLTYSTNQVINDLLILFYSVLYIFVFAFIDSTVPVARRSDPLLRSIFGWDNLRIALWVDTAAFVAVNAITQASYSNFLLVSNSTLLLLNILWFVLASILFGASGVALVIGARRSRDPFFQRSLKWLGLVLIVVMLSFVEVTIISFVVPGLSQFDFYYSYYNLPYGFLSIIYSYFLYRSARSLAPMSSLE